MKRTFFLAEGLPQSTLEPAGQASERIAELFYVMVTAGTAIWIVVLALAVYAIFVRGQHHPRKTTFLVIGGGALFPTITLTALLCFSLPMLPELHQPAEKDALTVEVAGVRWWWRVRYRREDGSTVETANEIRLPVNRPVEFKLSSEDVIHSFWIPSIGGKVDMIPGRQNRLRLVPTKIGHYRGACAEYCGLQHAQMSFDVHVVSQQQFDQWWQTLDQDPSLDSASGSSVDPAVLRHGRELFRQKGCAACHAHRPDVKGPRVGPDLTRLAERSTLGAGILPNNEENLRRWIRDPDAIKPGVNMPAFDAMTEPELDALVAYLEHVR